MSKTKVNYSVIRDSNWNFWKNEDGTYDNKQVDHALLMDIREELKQLNLVMQCSNVSAGFIALVEMNKRDKKTFNARVKRAVARKLKEQS